MGSVCQSQVGSTNFQMLPRNERTFHTVYSCSYTGYSFSNYPLITHSKENK
jgi:hypothetical protein